MPQHVRAFYSKYLSMRDLVENQMLVYGLIFAPNNAAVGTDVTQAH